MLVHQDTDYRYKLWLRYLLKAKTAEDKRYYRAVLKKMSIDVLSLPTDKRRK